VKTLYFSLNIKAGLEKNWGLITDFFFIGGNLSNLK